MERALKACPRSLFASRSVHGPRPSGSIAHSVGASAGRSRRLSPNRFQFRCEQALHLDPAMIKRCNGLERLSAAKHRAE